MSASLDDPHGELGVPRHASEHEIKRAWRRLAAHWHPDRNPHPRAAERMKRINGAYRQLVGAAAATAAPPAAAPAGDEEPPPRSPRPWWERSWGSARWEADGAAEPAPIVIEVELDLEQAAFGCVHAVRGEAVDLCAACAGVGRLLSRQTDCAACGGEGRVRPHAGARWKACAACTGDGAARKPCDTCASSGSAAARRFRFDVRIPPGMRDGQTLMLRGQGGRGAGGARGDIELRLRLRAHALFSFDAAGRLVCRMPVDAYAAAGGATVAVPLPGGATMPLDLSRGAVQVLDGAGYPNRDGSRGPLVVETHLVTPRVRTERQRELLRRLADDLRSGGYAGCEELAAWHALLRGHAAAGAGGGNAGAG